MQPVIRNAETVTAIEQGTFPEYNHRQLAGESNQEFRGLNSHESEERCDPRIPSRERGGHGAGRAM